MTVCDGPVCICGLSDDRCVCGCVVPEAAPDTREDAAFKSGKARFAGNDSIYDERATPSAILK